MPKQDNKKEKVSAVTQNKINISFFSYVFLVLATKVEVYIGTDKEKRKLIQLNVGDT